MLVLAQIAFGLSFLSYGLAIAPFLMVLFITGIALGVAASALVLRLGPASEWLIWPIPMLISPFAGVFYPVTVLPVWMQAIALILPPSYVFEGMRSVVAGQGAPWDRLAIGAALAHRLPCARLHVLLRRLSHGDPQRTYRPLQRRDGELGPLWRCGADTVRTRCDTSDSHGGTNRRAGGSSTMRGMMSQRLKAVFAAILILATGLFALAAEAQQPAPNPSIALVIGNATYRDAALATPANDAGLVAQTLQAAGFDVVGARDLDGQSLRTAFRDFLQKAAAAGPDMQAFVYLAGRAVQYNGDNYFVPVDAQINRDADVPIEAIRIADFSPCSRRDAWKSAHHRSRRGARQSLRNSGVAAGAGACSGRSRARRTDRLQRGPGHPGRRRGRPLRGLWQDARRRDPAGRRGHRPGVRSDASVGQRGDARRSAAVERVQARRSILRLRARRRRSSSGPLVRADGASAHIQFFRPRTPTPPLSSETRMKGYREFLAAYPNSDQARRVRAILAVRREAAYWRRTVGADTPRAYWTYLHTYPKGPHIPDARRRLAMLSAELRTAGGLSARGFCGSSAAAAGRTRLR